MLIESTGTNTTVSMFSTDTSFWLGMFGLVLAGVFLFIFSQYPWLPDMTQIGPQPQRAGAMGANKQDQGRLYWILPP